MPPASEPERLYRAEFHFDDILKGGRQLRLYRDPVEVIEVTERTALLPALSRLDELIARGYHAAGYISYEAGYALLEQTIWPGKFAAPLSPPKSDSARSSAPYRDWTTPLLSFGIFTGFEKPAVTKPPSFETACITPPIPDVTFQAYRRQALLIHEEILSGRTYQVNYTFFLDFLIRGAYRSLFHEIGPGFRYGALVESPGARVLSFSPELFFHRKGARMAMKPMKGTAPRGEDPGQDQRLAEALHHSAKERAENSMIVDLIRNDLGRISRPGSVRAFDICKVETYPTLHQMTSSIESRLLEQTTYRDIFMSLFPSGSVTGAPKLEAMKRIAALENRPRGVYTGAVGFIDPSGEAIFNVAIRTVEMPGTALHDSSCGESARMGIGSGFVFDSQVEEEYREALLKSKFLTSRDEPFELIEGVLLNRGVCYQTAAHLERLEKSASYFGYGFDRKKALSLLQSLPEKYPSGRYKVRLTLGPGGELAATVEPAPRDKSVLRLAFCEEPVESRSVFRRHKTSRRFHLDAAFRKAREAGFDEAVFFNERGEITETAIHNIFVLIGGEWITPPVSSGLLPGVMRGELLRRLRSAREGVLTREDLARAERIVLVNAIRGIREAVLG